MRLLANPRYLGVGFNPVSFYFLHGEEGAVEAVIAEVTNTPWGERVAYVLDGRARDGDAITAQFAKSMHVSPFQPMDQRYESPPARQARRFASRSRAFRTAGRCSGPRWRCAGAS